MNLWRDRSGRQLSFRLPRRGDLAGAVLVLHGGQVTSEEPTDAWQPAVLRVRVLAWAMHRRLGAHGIAVARLRFAVRGWNGSAASPVADATWALARIRAELGVPVVVVGHSMGGRTAVRVAGEAGVTGVVGLAPWLPGGEPVEQLAGRGLAIAHGDRDRITDPAESAAFAGRATAFARPVTFEIVPGDGHAMLRRARHWHQLAARHTLDLLSEPAIGGTTR